MNHRTFFLLVFALLFIQYSFGLNLPLYGDDTGRIQQIEQLADFSSVLSEGLSDRYFLQSVIWVLRVKLGLPYESLRIFNLLVLVGCSLIIRILLQVFLSPQKNPSLSVDLILFAFLAHPLQMTVVTHIIQLGITLSLFFALLATLMVFRSRFQLKNRHTLLAMLFWLLALLSKPNTIFLLPLWLILPNLIDVGFKRRLIYLLPFMGTFAIPVLYYMVGGQNVQLPISPWAYFLAQSASILHYARVLLWPTDLVFNNDIVLSSALPLHWALLVWGVLLGGFTAAIVKSPNSRTRFFVVGALVSFLPESSFFPINHVSFDHRVVVPFAFAMGALASLNLPVVSRKFAVGCVVTMLAVATWLSNMHWNKIRTYKSFLKYELSRSCKEPILFAYYFSELITNGTKADVDESIKSFKERCVPPVLTTSAIEIISDFVFSKSFESEKYLRVKNMFHSDAAIGWRDRTLFFPMIHDAIQNGLAAPGSSPACQLEDFYSNQLKFLVLNYELAKQELVTYMRVAKVCLENDVSSRPMFQELKIRTILHHYFGNKDKTLDSDLKRNLNLEGVPYLLELFRKPPLNASSP